MRQQLLQVSLAALIVCIAVLSLTSEAHAGWGCTQISTAPPKCASDWLGRGVLAGFNWYPKEYCEASTGMCTPDPPTGACNGGTSWTHASCILTSQTGCTSIGGTYAGDWTTCPLTKCQVSALSCTENVFQETCLAFGDTQCSGSSCPTKQCSLSLTLQYSDARVPGATEVDTYGINDAGAIVGDYVDSSGIQHGMILQGTHVTTVDRPACSNVAGANSIAFYGINSSNVAVGWCTDNNTGENDAFEYSNGRFFAIAPPGSVSTQANGISDKGAVAGSYIDGNGATHGFVLQGSRYTTIDIPGATATAAWGINVYGDVTVYTGVTAAPFTSYILSGQKRTRIGDPNAGSNGTVIHTINNRGDVVGTYYDASGNVHGFLYHQGTYYDVNDPNGAQDSRGDGLNDAFGIVGRYSVTLGGASLGFQARTTP